MHFYQSSSDEALRRLGSSSSGLSAAMEIGFATAQKCPVFSRTAPQDIALRGLVKVVPSVYDVLCVVGLR